MKHFLAVLLLVSLSFSLSAQQQKFTGTWEGDLDAGMQKLRLVFNISQNETGVLQLSMQSPQQSAMQVPADTAYAQGGTLTMEMKKFGISFSGKLVNDSTLEGEFVQGKPFPLQLKKVEDASVVSQPKRPQTPKPPYAYKSIEVGFTNKDQSLRFAGTLTLPDTGNGKKYPAVILISGSGPQDRDETIFGHKPFAIIADHLTKNGFGVLRVDDRGTGRSTGVFSTATSADFAKDTEAALDYLATNASIDTKQIGLIGHSEGGQIAPMVASKRKEVSFIVLLAGPGIPCLDLMAEQNVTIFRSNGFPENVANAYGPLYKQFMRAIINSADSATALANGIKILNDWKVVDTVKQIFRVATPEDQAYFTSEKIASVNNPWFRYFLSYDPVPVLKSLSCAVLALNGSRDLQVLPASNLKGMEAALKKSKTKNYEIKEIPGVNHLFQTCNSCSLEEYATLEESFSPAVLTIMTEWLQKQVK